MQDFFAPDSKVVYIDDGEGNPDSEDSDFQKSEKQFLLENTDLPEDYIDEKTSNHFVSDKSDEHPVYLTPSLQLGIIDLKDDEIFLQDYLKVVNEESNTKLHWATGYFNPPRSLLEAIKKVPTRFLTSAPKANGFFNGGLVKKYIPWVYRSIEESVLKKYGENIEINEW